MAYLGFLFLELVFLFLVLVFLFVVQVAEVVVLVDVVIDVVIILIVVFLVHLDLCFVILLAVLLAVFLEILYTLCSNQLEKFLVFVLYVDLGFAEGNFLIGFSSATVMFVVSLWAMRTWSNKQDQAVPLAVNPS